MRIRNNNIVDHTDIVQVKVAHRNNFKRNIYSISKTKFS
jgi:hypothetical protein